MKKILSALIVVIMILGLTAAFITLAHPNETEDVLPECWLSSYFAWYEHWNGEVLVNNSDGERSFILEPAPFLYVREDGEPVVMVPLRAAMVAMWAGWWDEQGEQLDSAGIITWNEDTSEAQLGSLRVKGGRNTVYVGDSPVPWVIIAPQIIDNRMFVPLNFFHMVLRWEVNMVSGQFVLDRPYVEQTFTYLP